MKNIACLVHSGDSIGGSGGLYNGVVQPTSYFFQAYGFSPLFVSATPYQAACPTYTGISGTTPLIARNMCIAGTRLNTNGFPDLVPMAPLFIDPIIPVSYTIPPFDKTRGYIFTCAIGSNDECIGSYGAGNFALFAAAVAAACVARKNAGFEKVAMCTILPRNDGHLLESNRLGYNQLILSSGWAAANGVDAIIDLAGEATMGNPANCSNTEWFIDGVHPTQAGHALLAPIYKAGVDALVASL